MTLKDDYYNFDEENYRLVGEQHGRVFRLGEPVRVRCLLYTSDAADD